MNTTDDEIVRLALCVLQGRLACNQNEVLDEKAVKNFASLHLGQLQHEVFGAMFFGIGFNLITYRQLFSGTTAHCAVYPREVAKAVLQLNAVYVVLVHNHPGGGCYASEEDVSMTHKLQKCLELIDVMIVDHLIVAGKDVYSMQENEQMLGYPTT